MIHWPFLLIIFLLWTCYTLICLKHCFSYRLSIHSLVQVITSQITEQYFAMLILFHHSWGLNGGNRPGQLEIQNLNANLIYALQLTEMKRKLNNFANGEILAFTSLKSSNTCKCRVAGFVLFSVTQPLALSCLFFMFGFCFFPQVNGEVKQKAEARHK